MSAYSSVTPAHYGVIQDAVRAAFKGEQVIIACSSVLQADQVKKMIVCSFPFIKQDLIQVEVVVDTQASDSTNDL